MGINSEIYLIGLAILFFLIIAFLFIRKVSNTGNLKVKIESIPDPFDTIEEDNLFNDFLSGSFLSFLTDE